MKLTKEEIEAIADRLDEIIGNHFHDAICSIISEREYIDLDDTEVSDEDVQKIKNAIYKCNTNHN